MSKSRPRLYSSQTLVSGNVIALNEAEVHYLRDVLRMDEGAEVSLFNEQGEWKAIIQFFKKNKGEVLLQDQTRRALVPVKTKLVLIFALIKRDAMDWAVEKASELGVHSIQPVITARTQSQHTNIDRLQTIAREAAEQCDRLDVPSVAVPVQLVKFLDGWPKTAPLLFAAESGDALPAAIALSELPETDQAGVLIGPEGGFTAEEHAILRRQNFIHAIRLGPRLMRAETAAIAALATYQAVRGDWI